MSQRDKILIFDIETAPILAYVWGLFDQNVGLNQIHSDWYVLSWSAKWLGESKVLYQDQRGKRDIENDKSLLAGIWKLLDEADMVVTQNGIKFDVKKLNARFVAHGMKPPSPFKHFDTAQVARSKFGFTSNKLEYLTDKLCKTYKKEKSREFQGFELWRECLNGNPKAWRAMEKYNRMDVLSLEELFKILEPWGAKINRNIFRDNDSKCNCGSTKLQKRGTARTGASIFQRFQCQDCGAWSRDSINLSTSKKRQML